MLEQFIIWKKIVVVGHFDQKQTSTFSIYNLPLAIWNSWLLHVSYVIVPLHALRNALASLPSISLMKSNSDSRIRIYLSMGRKPIHLRQIYYNYKVEEGDIIGRRFLCGGREDGGREKETGA